MQTTLMTGDTLVKKESTEKLCTQTALRNIEAAFLDICQHRYDKNSKHWPWTKINHFGRKRPKRQMETTLMIGDTLVEEEKNEKVCRQL